MAIKAVKTLIRLHKRELDELRRRLGSLQNQKDQLLQASQRLDADLADEQRRAESMPEMAAFMGQYAQRIRERKERIAAEVAKLDEQMRVLSEDIAVKFSELKKYEIVRENWEKREREMAEKKESAQLDEVALQQFIRQTEEG